MRLLVVEDDRLLNNTLCYNLSAAGYTVDAAMSKSAAVNFCEAQDYDLIVLMSICLMEADLTSAWKSRSAVQIPP